MTQPLTPDAAAIDDVLAEFAQSALGGGLVSEAAELVGEASRLREQPDEALALLERARAIAPGHPVPLIALYRFHFYGHRLAEARAVGEDALSIVRSVLGAGCGVEPPPRDAVRYDAAVRFYLFTLKGLAYLNMRLGEMESASALLGELRRLDPEDQVGSALLLHVLMRYEAGVDADDPDASPRGYPARGWEVQP